MQIEILTFSLIKMRLKVLSAKLRPFCLVLNVSIQESALPFEHAIFKMAVLKWLWKILTVCVTHLTLYVLNFSERT